MDENSNARTIALRSRTHMPRIGFGTFNIPREDTQRCVEEALAMGYRLIDTATAYGNEAQVGAAIAASGMRGQAFVTGKLRNADQGRGATLRAFERTRKALRVDVLDLYLIHWPCPARDLYVETWRTMLELRDQGAVREVGVSNFLPEHLERLAAQTGELPAVNQIESHPRWWQPELDAYCKQNGIAVEAYAPLGRAGDLQEDVVVRAAAAHGVTPAQVILRWHVQMGHAFVPKSAHAERMRSNLDVYGFSLTSMEMQAICSVCSADPHRVCGDPATYEDPQLG